MAFKDLTDYYNGVKKNYFKMLQMLEKFDAKHKEGLIEDEAFNNVVKSITNIKGIYESLCYFFMLWSKPSKEEEQKCEEWKKDHKEEYEYLKDRDPDCIIKQEKEMIKEISKYLKEKTK